MLSQNYLPSRIHVQGDQKNFLFSCVHRMDIHGFGMFNFKTPDFANQNRVCPWTYPVFEWSNKSPQKTLNSIFTVEIVGVQKNLLPSIVEN